MSSSQRNRKHGPANSRKVGPKCIVETCCALSKCGCWHLGHCLATTSAAIALPAEGGKRACKQFDLAQGAVCKQNAACEMTSSTCALMLLGTTDHMTRCPIFCSTPSASALPQPLSEHTACRSPGWTGRHAVQLQTRLCPIIVNIFARNFKHPTPQLEMSRESNALSGVLIDGAP